jgi:hypothetical protein
MVLLIIFTNSFSFDTPLLPPSCPPKSADLYIAFILSVVSCPFNVPTNLISRAEEALLKAPIKFSFSSLFSDLNTSSPITT